MAQEPLNLNQFDARCKAAHDNWYTLSNWTFRLGVPSVIASAASTTVDVIYKDGAKGRLPAKNVTWSQVEKFRVVGGEERTTVDVQAPEFCKTLNFGGAPDDAAPTETKIDPAQDAVLQALANKKRFLATILRGWEKAAASSVLPIKVPTVDEVQTGIASSVKVHQGAEALFPHYHKDVSHLGTIDIYRVLQLWNVTDPCIQHAVKKLLVAGGRGHKGMTKDVHEAIVSLQRWEEMRAEDGVEG